MADQRRLNRQAGVIKKALGEIIDVRLEDPHKGYITITRVRMSTDLRIASVYYTVLGDDEQKRLSKEVLKRSTAYLRNELRPSIHTRWLPELRFFYDESIEYADRINQLLKKIEDDSHTDEK